MHVLTENDALYCVLVLYLPCGIGATTNQPLVSVVSSRRRGVCAGMRARCGACPPTPSLPTHPWSTCVWWWWWCAVWRVWRVWRVSTSLLSLPLRALHLEQRVAPRANGHLTQLAGMGFGYGNDCVWDFVVKSRHSTWNPTHFTTNPTTSPHPNPILGPSINCTSCSRRICSSYRSSHFAIPPFHGLLVSAQQVSPDTPTLVANPIIMSLTMPFVLSGLKGLQRSPHG